MEPEQESPAKKPSYVLELEKAFGGPSQSAFGTAVFFDPDTCDREMLDKRALTHYQHFCGKTWDQFGSENWLSTWELVHSREGQPGQIVSELKELTDPDARISASSMLDGHDDPSLAQNALALAFDDTAVQQLQIYKIGDGAAMSGILIAAQRVDEGSMFLIFLMD